MPCTIVTPGTITGPGLGCALSITLPTQVTEMLQCQCIGETEISYSPSGIIDLGELTITIAGIVDLTPGDAASYVIAGVGTFTGKVLSCGGARFEAGSSNTPETTVVVKIESIGA